MIDAVFKHARATADYQTNNWDIAVECWDSKEVDWVLFDEHFTPPQTCDEAIAKAKEALDLIAEVHFGRFGNHLL
jgi:hypothetical protein